jgi:hypothetical protein
VIGRSGNGLFNECIRCHPLFQCPVSHERRIHSSVFGIHIPSYSPLHASSIQLPPFLTNPSSSLHKPVQSLVNYELLTTVPEIILNIVSPVPKYAFANVRIDESGICSVAGLDVSSAILVDSSTLSDNSHQGQKSER